MIYTYLCTYLWASGCKWLNFILHIDIQYIHAYTRTYVFIRSTTRTLGLLWCNLELFHNSKCFLLLAVFFLLSSCLYYIVHCPNPNEPYFWFGSGSIPSRKALELHFSQLIPLGLIMYTCILTTLEFPTHNFDFHLVGQFFSTSSYSISNSKSSFTFISFYSFLQVSMSPPPTWKSRMQETELQAEVLNNTLRYFCGFVFSRP